MQFIDLAAQQKRIRPQIEAAFKKILNHGQYILGPEIRELEEKLAAFTGAPYAVAVASGTDALLMPLMVENIGPGDAVFTSTFTFIATAEVIRLLGATPVFVDIDPETFNIDPQKLEGVIQRVCAEKKLTPRGIIPVDLFGQPADYPAIQAIADKYRLFVLEDAAQSFGASQKGKKAGALAAVAATSFFPAKPLGCYGDGGMIFSDDRNIYEQLLSIRVHGQGVDKYTNVRVGINGRMDSLQAAVLLAKMEIFAEEMQLRQEVAARYDRMLAGSVTVPKIRQGNISAWAQYSVLHPRRDEIIKKLRENSIPTAVYYPIPLHLQQAFADLGYRKNDFPVAEKIAGEIFSLPMHPYLEAKDQERICNIIKT
ncbi:MAG: DegT/DnrJ/EryC1/StrS aminotransferase family protein [Kiritimatiellae bacterium]|nr:DegT/DnrJ/EryC1/StrS aminotransferase family protein [Kiritimatiellia bacterium]MCG2812742.1 DegT/DnrJ/EryC1/StrS aminotransferase family protein [Candidatus Aminicenantes bacterium]